MEWIWVEEEPDPLDEELGKAPVAKKEETPPKKGSTGVTKGKGTEGTSSQEVLPHLLRIQLSSDVAREFFMEARLSGVWDSGSG